MLSVFRNSDTQAQEPASVSPKARLIHDHTKNTVFGFLNAVFYCVIFVSTVPNDTFCMMIWKKFKKFQIFL